MYRLFVCVLILITHTEQRYSSLEDFSVSLDDHDNDYVGVTTAKEERALVQPFEIDLREKFTDAFALEDSKQRLKQKKKKIKKKEEPKKTKTKPKKGQKDTKSDNKKTTKAPKKQKQASNSLKIIIDNNIFNIKGGPSVQIEGVSAEYEDESDEEGKEDKRGCNICGWLPNAKWPPFNPPFWPFN